MFDVKKSIQEIETKIINVIQEEYPQILANLAEDIFASGGQSHGRSWESNKASTVKKKGGNSPNIDTGQLENWMTIPGNILEEDFMSHLPNTPNEDSNIGYFDADSLRPFHDIGQTSNDEEYISEQLSIKIKKAIG